MDDKMTVPYIVYEGEQVRNERTTKRLLICVILCIVLLFVSNAVWLYCWMQFEYVDMDHAVSVEAKDGIANFIGNDGDITNGAGNSAAENESGD